MENLSANTLTQRSLHAFHFRSIEDLKLKGQNYLTTTITQLNGKFPAARFMDDSNRRELQSVVSIKTALGMLKPFSKDGALLRPFTKTFMYRVVIFMHPMERDTLVGFTLVVACRKQQIKRVGDLLKGKTVEANDYNRTITFKMNAQPKKITYSVCGKLPASVYKSLT